MQTKTALIVGAGVGGMAAAWWLLKKGWHPLVVEKAPELRTDGYMLGLSGPGYTIAGEMGLMPALRARHRPIHENVYFGRDGRELWRAKYQELLGHQDWITLSRTDLVEVLHDALPDDLDLRFGTTVTGIEEDEAGVTATLSDGSNCRADLLIAADGMHSTIRRMAFGEDSDFIRPLGYRFAAFQMQDDLALGHDFLSFAEPGRMTEIYSLSDGRLATLYAWKTDDQSRVPATSRRDCLRAAYTGAHETALHYIDALPSDDALFFDNLELVEMPSWSTGRIVLLGDAAHCLTLISGQGAGMAITSAKVLADELSKNTVEDALTGHEQRLRPAIIQLQERSRKIAPLFIPSTPRAFAIRNFVMRHAPKRLLGWYLARSIRTEALSAAAALEPTA
ncbi:FAD-dependent oxidoreductase [Nisaea acidiphila]|uniref:FAD-dependent oxidoreductase n=1 Tax=Nisaea acidiphila TaxID=1862145 RepID=A0A9J7ARV2_9PROT|nr:FAD-dependent monooxygenase [Nisaea acidiphila]UUX49942.1 FAD-dependent oxidoreductase [Nisaea acidiphila]